MTFTIVKASAPFRLIACRTCDGMSVSQWVATVSAFLAVATGFHVAHPLRGIFRRFDISRVRPLTAPLLTDILASDGSKGRLFAWIGYCLGKVFQ